MTEPTPSHIDSAPDPNAPHPAYLEIDTGRKTRWIGLTAYILLFVAIAAAVVFVFIRFSGSVGMAVLLVGFMVAYMLIMGFLAGKNPDERNF